MKDEIVSACTSYGTCALIYLHSVDWATVGAVVLLVARLAKDVPDAYDAIMARRKSKKKQTKKRKKRNVKSNR